MNTLVMFGKAPASPAPNSARMTIREVAFQAQPVAAVKRDHQTTIRMSTRRGPMRSPSQPPGISKSAYAHANAASTHPCWTRDSPRSSLMTDSDTEIATRSI